MRKIIGCTLLIALFAAAGGYAWWTTQRDVGHYLSDLRIELAINEGVNNDRGNLLGIEPDLSPRDYQSLALVHLKLAMVELEPAHAALMPAELSGGMVKRVALARALSLEPELLLLDEPTAGLDPDRSLNFVDLVASLQRALGLTVIMVTHDLATLAGLATHVAVLADGHIAVHGTRAEVMDHDHPFVTGFFGPDRKKLL